MNYTDDDLEKVAFEFSDMLLGATMFGAKPGEAGSSPFSFNSLAPKLLLGETISPMLGTFGYQVNRAVNSGIEGVLTRVKADEMAAGKAVGALTELAIDATKGLGSSLVKKFQEASEGPKRTKILGELYHEDDMLKNTDPKILNELYQTMKKFAPTLSLDKNAVKSFLRAGASFPEGGVDVNTIQMLAKAENLAQGKKGD